jgi:hypothetical protein
VIINNVSCLKRKTLKIKMSQKTYKVNSQRQLVDLNGDSKNFDLTFTCTSKDSVPFQILVVDQATLDSTPNLQYKEANGTISGNIVADKDVYQNYFLVLRADKPCEVTVNTVKKDISPTLPTSQDLPKANKSIPLKPPSKVSNSNWKTIAIVILVFGGGALLYYFYSQSNKKKSNVTETSETILPVPLSPALSNTSSLSPPSSTVQSALLDRLKNLDISN